MKFKVGDLVRFIPNRSGSATFHKLCNKVGRVHTSVWMPQKLYYVDFGFDKTYTDEEELTLVEGDEAVLYNLRLPL